MKSQITIQNIKQHDSQSCVGIHLLLDFWQVPNQLDQVPLMDATLRQAVKAAGACLLHLHLHHFTPQGGISGVAVLAESHICVHTWPERSYAAFDIFMCGDTDPYRAVTVLKEAFNPGLFKLEEKIRGELVESSAEC